MDQHSLESALADIPLGDIHYYASIGSTNDEAARHAGTGAPPFSLFVADEQTAGKGRSRRKWITRPGSALAFSLLVSPGSQSQEQLGRWMGLGAVSLVDTFRSRYALTAEIKWPNDVLISGRKVAGILAEAHWIGDHLNNIILGVGINIAPESVPAESELTFPATCLHSTDGFTGTREELLHDVLSDLLRWIQCLDSEIFLDKWTQNMAFQNDIVRVTFPNQPPITGRIAGLTASGHLRLETASNGEIIVDSGEIQMRTFDKIQD